MPPRIRIFIDFWNFQLGWNARMNGQHCDWKRLPGALVSEADRIVQETGGGEDRSVLEETLLYASVDPSKDAKLRGWLENVIDRFPSYRVDVKERRPQRKSVRCKECGHEVTDCSNCGHGYSGMVEKGVDTAIVTDLLSLAWQDAYDIAIIVSSDADFVPAAIRLQERGLKVINAGWSGTGHHLAKACWGSFNMDDLAQGICR